MKSKVFCAFCRVPHKVYATKHIPLFAVIGLTVSSMIFSFLVWQEFRPVALLLAVFLCFILELFFQSRWRQSIKCQACGFDPIVYKSQPEKAAEIVKMYLELRKEDPRFLLKPMPQLSPEKKENSQSVEL